ncbi:MAG: hypothetical protein IPF59_08080 [Ignavibacteria bacterium]|nr:hypothetical protein [Ignavibacteria bacterium]MBK6420289.1 hypothetical protein [Ignavibacteria bacterium]MBK7412759.1 hypothetical protein [Ignavibacteria bacterium]
MNAQRNGGGSSKYDLPSFLDGRVDNAKYQKWLRAKAAIHLRRDKKRNNMESTNREYLEEIHRAVCASNGLDDYTGETLSWELIGTYDNEESKKERRKYKHRLGLLPTVDHVGDGTGPAAFRICSWKTNDAKGDLSYEEFVSLCRQVVAFHAMSGSSGSDS